MEKCAIGVDIGSKYTVIAAVTKTGVETLTTDDGHAIPTILAYGENERHFGKEAQNHIKSNLLNTLTHPNRYVGLHANTSSFAEESKYSCNNIIPYGNNQFAFSVKEKGKPSSIIPEQAIASFLKYIVHQVEKKGLGANSMVISCPNYWNQLERIALLDACKIAQINCTRIISELTATCLGYGIFRAKDLNQIGKVVAIVDFGHSKTSIAIASFFENEFKILGQAWNKHLGVRNLDYKIVEYGANKFHKSYGINPMSNPKAKIKLFQEVEKARTILSANSEADINIECLAEDCDLTMLIKRDEFEALIQNEVQQFIQVLTNAIQQANLSNPIQTVELVGDGTRIPIIIQTIRNIFGIEPSRTMVSSEACARGCAIQSAMLNPLFKVRKYQIHEINTYPIEITYNENSETKSMMLFNQYSPFPLSKSVIFHQRFDHIKIQLRYTSPVEGISVIGEYITTEPKPKEKEFSVICKAKLDANMICNITMCQLIEQPFTNKRSKTPNQKTTTVSDEVENDDTQAEQRMVDDPIYVENNKSSSPTRNKLLSPKQLKKHSTDLHFTYNKFGLTLQEIGKIMDDEKAVALIDEAILNAKSKKNECESCVYDIRNKLQNAFSEYIELSVAKEIIGKVEAIEKWLYNEGKSVPPNEYESKTLEMRQLIYPIAERYRQYSLAFDKLTIIGNLANQLHIVAERGSQSKAVNPSDLGIMHSYIDYFSDIKVKLSKALTNCDKKADAPPALSIEVEKQILEAQEVLQ
jgi:heat shock protein 4